MFEAFCREFDCKYYEDGWFLPDYVFMQSGAISKDEVLAIKNFGATITQWTGDWRPEPLPEVINTSADITLLASAIGQQHLYPGSKYLQHAASVFLPVREDAEGISAIWNHYDQFEGGRERNGLADLLEKEFPEDFILRGSGGRCSVQYHKTPEFYNQSYIGISHSICNDVEGYWSNRPLDIMAAGCCCLMRYSPNLEKYFTDDEDCVFYHSNEDAVLKIRELKANPNRRNRIARKGQATVRNFHTYDYRVRQIKEYIQEYETK